MVVVRPDSLNRVLGYETLVICGPSRGGTSIISYVFLKIGYYLGEGLGHNHEDQDILTAMGNSSEMHRIVAERNQRFKRWGFKVPDAIYYIDWLTGALRNPVFVVSFRNPVATAKTILKREPVFRGAGLRGLASALSRRK